MSDSLRLSPLDAFHRRHGARMTPFAGWNLPVSYTGIIEEHRAVREACGIFDVSHMGQAFVSGERADEFMDWAFTNVYSDMSQGTARYSILCASDGGCLDDVIAMRVCENQYLIVLNASNRFLDVSVLRERAEKFGVKVGDISDSCAMLAVQGKDAVQIMEHADFGEYCGLAKYAFVKKGSMYISRTGYTGSDGFEIICDCVQAESLAEKFVAAGAVVCGLGARDSLRMEAKMPLYGHEINCDINPYEANLGWAVKLAKNFVGSEALRKIKENGVARKVAWFKVLDKRMARSGTEIFSDGKIIGVILSGGWSPNTDAPICSAIVDLPFSETTHFSAQIRGVQIPLQLIAGKKNFI